MHVFFFFNIYSGIHYLLYINTLNTNMVTFASGNNSSCFVSILQTHLPLHQYLLYITPKFFSVLVKDHIFKVAKDTSPFICPRGLESKAKSKKHYIIVSGQEGKT